MIYSKKQIELLCGALRGNVEARRTLFNTNRELVALEGAIMDDVKSTEWLIKNCLILAVFCDVINGNKKAVRVLIAKNEPGLAAAANFLKGDQKAELWLRKHDLEHYIDLAESITYAQEHRKKNGGNVFSPFG